MRLLVDSTGVKLCGPGDWLVKKHGTRRYRAWRTLHIGLDTATGRMVAATLTDHDVDDASQVGPLLDQTAEPRDAVLAKRNARGVAQTDPGVQKAVADLEAPKARAKAIDGATDRALAVLRSASRARPCGWATPSVVSSKPTAWGLEMAEQGIEAAREAFAKSDREIASLSERIAERAPRAEILDATVKSEE